MSEKKQKKTEAIDLVIEILEKVRDKEKEGEISTLDTKDPLPPDPTHPPTGG